MTACFQTIRRHFASDIDEKGGKVELRAVEMPTKYGRKSKPMFKIVEWKTADAEQAAPVERQITTQKAKQEVDFAEMDDEIPF